MPPWSHPTRLLVHPDHAGGGLLQEVDAEVQGLVRGKYYRRAMAGTNLVLLEPDVARAFPDSGSVNRALRLLHHVTMQSAGRTRKSTNGRRRTS